MSKAMILAAGLGTRMRPLTDRHPKPLLKVAGKCLIDFHLERLAQLGISTLVVNTHWLSEQIEAHLNTHWADTFDLKISYEPELLETAGGIRQAIDYLDDPNDEPFLLVNSDIYFEADLQEWLQVPLDHHVFAEILLCPNPTHNSDGDFSFDAGSKAQGLLTKHPTANTHTYSGVGRYRPSIFRDLEPGPRPLGPLLRDLARSQQLAGLFFEQYWLDVGTPERLADLERRQSHPN